MIQGLLVTLATLMSTTNAINIKHASQLHNEAQRNSTADPWAGQYWCSGAKLFYNLTSVSETYFRVTIAKEFWNQEPIDGKYFLHAPGIGHDYGGYTSKLFMLSIVDDHTLYGSEDDEFNTTT